jgi:hypothetical protein
MSVVIERNYNLDIRNPKKRTIKEDHKPQKVFANILKKERRIAALLLEVERELARELGDSN